MDEREFCIDLGARICELDVNEFRKATEDWEILPIKRRGSIVGAFFMRGPEIHVCITEEFRGNWFTPKLWREVMVERPKKYGHVSTRVQKWNQKSIEFVNRAGFQLLGEKDDHFIFVRF